MTRADGMLTLSLTAILLGLNGFLHAEDDQTGARPSGSIRGRIEVARNSAIPDHAFKAGDVYASRAMRHARLMDYDNPGPVVVYLDTESVPPAPRELPTVRLERRRGRLAFDSELTVITRGDVNIHNTDSRPHVFYLRGGSQAQRARVPAAGKKRLALDENGPHTLFVLDAEDVQTSVFVGGRQAIRLDRPGEFEFLNIPVGAHVLHCWHARFPPTATNLTVSVGEPSQAQITLTVEHLPPPD